jgi:hypothetical protein
VPEIPGSAKASPRAYIRNEVDAVFSVALSGQPLLALVPLVFGHRSSLLGMPSLSSSAGNCAVENNTVTNAMPRKINFFIRLSLLVLLIYRK